MSDPVRPSSQTLTGSTHAVVFGVFASSLALYVATLAPTVTLVDSGELIVVARDLGVAHPPGFPLYTLLAHAATWLPVGTVAERVHALSALCAALATGVVVLLVVELWQTWRVQGAAALPRAGRRRAARDRPAGPSWVPLAGAALAGLLVASSRTLWAYATVAEVYTLNVFLVLGALLALIRWRRLQQAPTPDAPPSHAMLYLAAGAIGLALAVHHVTVVLMLPGFAWLAWSVARDRTIGRAVWLRAAGCGAAGLALYVYLPLAASASPVINWGDPDSLERFWWHISGRQYQVYFSFSLDTMLRQLGDDFGRYVLREFGPPRLPFALALAAAGFARLWRADRPLAASLALVALVDLAYALNYDIDEDKDAYYLPVFLVLGVSAGLGAARVLAWAVGRPPATRAALVAATAAVPALALAGNLPYNDRHDYFIARDYVANVAGSIDQGGLLLTSDWQVFAPSLYTRHVEGLRRDLVVIDVNLLRRTWYFDYLDREYSATMARVRAEADAYLEDLRQWDRDPRLYQRDLTRNRRISDRFHALIDALVVRHRERRPVYVTLDLLVQAPDVARRLAPYTAVPRGLVFELTDGGPVPLPSPPAFELRGLFDGTMAFEPDDVVRQKVAPAYLSMMVNRGRYLASRGEREAAAEAYRDVLALDPGNVPARESLATLGAEQSGG